MTMILEDIRPHALLCGGRHQATANDATPDSLKWWLTLLLLQSHLVRERKRGSQLCPLLVKDVDYLAQCPPPLVLAASVNQSA
jgi:hypothetical protein